MAIIINIGGQKRNKTALQKQIIKKHDTPGRKPEKAIDDMYGLWEGKDISIEAIRAEKRRKKW